MRVVVVVLLLQLPRPPAHLTKGIQHQGVHIGVQVRNRLWTLERHKHPEQTKWGKSMALRSKVAANPKRAMRSTGDLGL